jgi:hypothetical protein
MIPMTKDRLAEAEFFLYQLRQEQRQHASLTKSATEHFRYYLHAFLNAAYSSAVLLEREGKRGRRRKYEAWEASWKLHNVEETRLLDKLAWEVRGHAIHQGNLTLTPKSEKVPLWENDAHRYSNLSLPAAMMLTINHKANSYTYRDNQFITFDGEEGEVIKICELYMNLIEKKVHDCEIDLKSA